jgi:Spy/CpxP family protein refolding chaperone
MKLNLKSIGMAAALVAGLATLSIAGTGDKGPLSPQEVKEKVARMKADLALTDDQATQIEQIMNEASVQAQSLRPGSAADSSQSKDQLREQHKQTKERVRAVLTDEQRTKWDQLEKQRKSSQEHKKDGSH